MFKIKKILAVSLSTLVLTLSVVATVKPAPAGAVACSGGDFLSSSFLGIPAWYKYLEGEDVTQIDRNGGTGEVVCQPKLATKGTESIPTTDILLVIAALLEAMVRIAGLAAFIYLIYGGFMYLTSSGNPENVSKAGTTLLNAAIGLAIAISATVLINFFATRLGQ